jgi:hypothetical protein
VVIDPESKIMLTDHRVDAAIRLDPDESASLRASARVTYWTQTLMQGVGL